MWFRFYFLCVSLSGKQFRPIFEGASQDPCPSSERATVAGNGTKSQQNNPLRHSVLVALQQKNIERASEHVFRVYVVASIKTNDLSL